MNRKVCFYSILSAALLFGAAGARAQGHEHGGPPPFGGPMELMGFEGIRPGQVVKGAPFSATVTSETTHTLQDGTQIHRTTQGSLFRDSQGRSRRETTISGFGPFSTSGGTRNMVSIVDPVAGSQFMLDATNKTAHQMGFHQRPGSASSGTAQSFEQKFQARQQQEIASGLLKIESLGTQTINGVNAEGTRITRTIPVGQIGNDKPILSVSERWYSPDLQIVVKSTRTDPQFGTTTYTVTNIQRTEPAATLFAVPSDYTVQSGRTHGAGPGGAGPGMPPAPPDQD